MVCFRTHLTAAAIGLLTTAICLARHIVVAQGGVSPSKKVLQGADWELQMLGIGDDQTLHKLQTLARRRIVTMAVVGEGGVSQFQLADMLVQGNTLEYRDGATDPKTMTHDTGQLKVILELTIKLGVKVRVLVYQPPDDFDLVGQAFLKAGRESDIVVCFHSFWGPAVVQMAEKVRQASNALFIAPYGEIGEPRTGTSWQAHAAKPGGGGIPNFVTCIPLARKSPGQLLHPAARDSQDTETINFVAPSFHASGSGGTCPAAATTAAVAAYVVAASARKPTATKVVKLLRDTVTVDKTALTSVDAVTDDTVKQIEAEIARLIDPAQGGGVRRLDAAGILNLRNIYLRLAKKRIMPSR